MTSVILYIEVVGTCICAVDTHLLQVLLVSTHEMLSGLID